MVLSKFKPLISQRFVTKILDRLPRSYCSISLFEFLTPFPFSIFLQQNDGVVISFLFCSLQEALFCIFLLCMSYSMLHASTKLDPTNGRSCFTEWMTLFDWLGLLLILCIVPLRYMDHKAQWMVTSLAFLFNFMRIFKFSCMSR